MPPQHTSRMTPRGDDPWISVSDLGEFAFCPRAGLLSHEAAYEDSGTERDRRPGPRTIFDVEYLRRELKDLAARRRQLWIAVAITAAGATAAGVVVTLSLAFALETLSFVVLPLLVIAGVALSVEVKFLRDNFTRMAELKEQLRLAESAIASVPDPNHRDRRAVDWWSLLQGGCESVRAQDQYRDTKWKISGKPWRILVYRGVHKFPVFRMKLRRKKEFDDFGWYEWVVDKRIFHQHIIRTVAYAHLLEVCENATSPYGIVMYGATYDGKTIPVSPGQKKKFHDTLLDYRATIRDARQGKLPGGPHSTGVCRGCPWGKPEGFWIFKRSACGRRFHWRPPYVEQRR